MNPQWTPQQQVAIFDRGGGLLISAAAGSGKTAVLVERVVSMICDEENPVRADRFLIVTFTRAAAEELRGRIAQRLTKEQTQHPGSQWLRRQRLLLGRADICTIDSFCMQLLKDCFEQLNLPPDFTLAETPMVFSLQEQAISETLEQAYQDEDFCKFVSLYGRARSDQAAAGAVLALYQFARTLPNSNRVLDKLYQDYETQAPLGETLWGKVLLQEGAILVQSAKTALQTALSLIAEEPLLANYEPALTEELSFFELLQSKMQNGDWDSAMVLTATCVRPALKAVRGYDGPIKDTVKSLRDSVKKVLEQLQAKVFICTQAEFAQDIIMMKPMLLALIKATKQFGEIFYAKKIEEKVLEYSDFEHLSLQLLCTPEGERTPMAQSISARYDAVMVDEYQDTNAMQALLYQCLAKEDGSNLFFVGDIKQSIYRFRLASPEIFIAKRKEFAPYLPNGPHPATITLGHNFRSTKTVIDQINDVFSCLMSTTVGDVEYNENEKLYAGVQDEYAGDAMEIIIADTSETPKEQGDIAVVVQRIQTLVQSRFPVRAKEGGTRPCQYSDICILLRSRGKFALYEAALKQLEIPVTTDQEEGVLTSHAVAPLLSVLRVIDNPAQDIPLAATLLSPMFGFTTDDLTRLRANAPNTSLYAALVNSKTRQARDFCGMLRSLRRFAVTASVEQLCEEIFVQTHYFAAVGAMEHGAECREMLRSFTAWAKSASAGGLSAFLRMVDHAIDSDAKIGATQTAQTAQSVSIMTIHRSKGLEFPVVILADCAKEFNLRDTSNAILFHHQIGIGFQLRAGEGGGQYNTIPRSAIHMAQRAESISEEMRILYVALTRAKDKLIITLPLEKPGRTLASIATSLVGAQPRYFFRKATSFSAWLCAFGLLHPDGENLRKAAGGVVLPLLKAQGALRTEIVSAQGLQTESALQAFVRKAKPDVVFLNQLRENFATAYKNAPLSDLPTKVSVSSLSHQNGQPVLARPGFLYKQGLTAAERGTAMHSMLQFADLKQAKQDSEKEVERLVQEGFIERQLADKLEHSKIKAFFQTPLATRMQQAQTLLREYAFLTAVPAKYVKQGLPEEFQTRTVLVQGIADAVLINGDTAEIVDYKTDKSKTPAQFVQTYQKQLLLYRAAIEKRLQVTVSKCTIYSFSLAQEIDVPIPS